MKRVLIAAVLLLITGCASRGAVPECDYVQASVMRTPQGTMFVFDMAGMQALAARMRALQAGECRMPEAQPEGRVES